jgi:hypothetical protein
VGRAGGGGIILLKSAFAGGVGGTGGVGIVTGDGGGGGKTFFPDCANVAEEHKRNTPKNFVCNSFIIYVFSKDDVNIIFHK